MISNNYTRENNILIANFLCEIAEDRSLKLYRLPKKIIPYIVHPSHDDEDHEIEVKDAFYEWESQFHTSWDWLMPVVEKCFKLSSVGIRITYDIDEQYNIVMSFIKAYKK